MNITDIDLKSLEVLDALLVEKNVTRTAERVGLSQPAVSNCLARLRKLLEDPLLIRTRSGMVPTDRAQQMIEPIRQAMRLLESAVKPVTEFDPQSAHSFFKIAATDYAEWLVLPRLCGQVAELAPQVRLEADPLKDRVPFRELERGNIDLAIGYFPDPPDSLFQKELFTEEFVGVAGPKFPHKSKKLSLEQFVKLKHMLVAPWGGMASLIDSLLAKQGMSRAVCVSTTRFLVAPRIIQETPYLVTLPRRVAESFAEHLPLTLYPVPVELPVFHFRLIWHKRTHYEPAHRWLRTQVASACAFSEPSKKAA